MINSILFLTAPLLSSILVAVAIVVLDSSVGLHRLVIVGDVELFLSSVIFGFGVTALLIYARRRVQSENDYLMKHVEDCSLLYVVTIIALLYAILNNLLLSGGLESAYILVLIFNCVIILLSNFLINKFVKKT